MKLVTSREPSPRPVGQLHAEAGDTLMIDGGDATGRGRIGTIVAVAGPDGSPPYLVHWLAGDYDSTISPAAGACLVKHR